MVTPWVLQSGLWKLLPVLLRAVALCRLSSRTCLKKIVANGQTPDTTCC